MTNNCLNFNNQIRLGENSSALPPTGCGRHTTGYTLFVAKFRYNFIELSNKFFNQTAIVWTHISLNAIQPKI